MGWLVPKRLPCEGPEPIIGPGVSRPRANESTREYRLTVKQPGKPAMRVTIPAPSKSKAIKYCKNRWPDAVVEALK
jgi:hypothetical protein